MLKNTGKGGFGGFYNHLGDSLGKIICIENKYYHFKKLKKQQTPCIKTTLKLEQVMLNQTFSHILVMENENHASSPFV